MQDKQLEELAIQSQKGDRVSYRLLLKSISPILHQYISKSLFEVNMRDDVVQDILLSLHRGLHTYLPGRSFKAWMFAIAKFRVIDHLRVYYRDKERMLLTEDFSSVPEIVTRSQLDTNSLIEALQLLPEKYREAIKVTKLQDISVKEAALKLGVSEDALKARLSRGYKMLRKKLEKVEYEGT